MRGPSSMDVTRPAPRGCLTEIDSPRFTAVCSGNTLSLRDEEYGCSGRHFDRVGRLLRLCVDPGSVAEGREREGQTSRALERAVYTAQLTRRSLPTSRAKAVQERSKAALPAVVGAHKAYSRSPAASRACASHPDIKHLGGSRVGAYGQNRAKMGERVAAALSCSPRT